MKGYEVHRQCMQCGRRFSYRSDGSAESKVCPNGPHTPELEELRAKRGQP